MKVGVVLLGRIYPERSGELLRQLPGELAPDDQLDHDPLRTRELRWDRTVVTHQEIAMSSSTLTPGNLPASPDRRILQGHGTAALGPSDTSDSGSDMQGAPGIAPGLDAIDSDLDSDTDSGGTGERAAADRDFAARDGADIDTDHIEHLAAALEDDELEDDPPQNAKRKG